QLYDAPGSGTPPTGGTLLGTEVAPNHDIVEGLFTVQLDFGSGVFDGDARWLQVAVDCGGGAVTLSPRQALTPAPYAIYAPAAGSAPWSGLTGVPADLADGDDDTTYSAATGLTLSGGAFSLDTGYRLPQTCNNGEIAEWNGAAWVCSTDDVGSGNGGGDITAVNAGAGLLGGGPSGDVTLDVDFAGSGTAETVARSDHDHDAAYVNDDVGEVGNADVPVGSLSPDRVSGTAWTGDNDGAGSSLDADLLDGEHASFYRDATSLNAGTLSTRRYSAYSDLGVENRLDNDAGSDLLTRDQADGRYWHLGGNSGTDPTTDFLGTTDEAGLTMAVSGTAALRIDLAWNPLFGYSPNVIGGFSDNSVAPEAVGATISGGGLAGGHNTAGLFATVGGGYSNTASGDGATVGGGYGNTASGVGSFVGGGGYDGTDYLGNQALAPASTIAGGFGNLISSTADYGTVGGGAHNEASGAGATVAGGWHNVASGYRATVGGGHFNAAEGDFSFAAGFGAKALHEGSFVWADSGDIWDFESTAPHQFRVRATNGAHFATSNDSYALEVFNNGSGHGVQVSNAGGDGLFVSEALDDGVTVVSAGNRGVAVNHADGDGLYVCSTGSQSGCSPHEGDNGLEVGNAANNGVHVARAYNIGVYAEGDSGWGFYTPDAIYAGSGYSDIAEHIDTTGEIEAGDVVVIDPDHDEQVVKSTEPYDTAVAGIISTDPAMVIGKSDTETPLALAGRVLCKVSAENGPIHRGDLLTTSSTPGHAMKATEPKLGTILGKSMGELESGTGVITVLVTLQ
ncbi:MAG: hypothetical protein PVG71_11065, partial [Anaerolineae bacterium]